jgi:hypothetical protein
VIKNHVEAICGDYRIHLVVWKEVKDKNPDEPLARNDNQWPRVSV